MNLLDKLYDVFMCCDETVLLHSMQYNASNMHAYVMSPMFEQVIIASYELEQVA